MDPFIPVFRPGLPDADRLLPYLRRIDEARIYTNWGPLAAELEQRLARLFQWPELAVVSASSGTAALIGAILAAAGRATSGRPLALLPAMTFVATAVAVEQCGYQPYLVDVDDDWVVDMESLQRHALLDRVGVVVAAAPFGRAVLQAPCAAFRSRTGIPVVIDGGGSFEQISDDSRRHLGAVPVALSFHATKSFATGEGGCVVTADEDLSDAIVRALNFGFLMSRDSAAASTNGKMSEYHAAVGLAELDNWENKRRAFRSVAASYREQFAGIGAAARLIGPPVVASCYSLLEAADAETSARIAEKLHDERIETRFWYGAGVHRQSHFEKAKRDALPMTESLLPRIVGLPMAHDLADASLARIARAVQDTAGAPV